MNSPGIPPQPPLTLPASSAALLADLLTQIDEFLRSSDARTGLADFLASRGRTHPRYDACLMIDQVSLTAARLRDLTSPPRNPPA